LIGIGLTIFSRLGENFINFNLCNFKDNLPTFFTTVFIAMFIGLVVQSFMDKKSPADEL
jgi:hypothetical protein